MTPEQAEAKIVTLTTSKDCPLCKHSIDHFRFDGASLFAVHVKPAHECLVATADPDALFLAAAESEGEA